MIMRAALVATIAVLVAFGTGNARLALEAAQAQNPTPQTKPQPQPTMGDMMKMHEQMMAEMKAADAKLDALVKEMNAAGDAKINAMAAVVTELVRQQKSMHAHMGQMHEQMMGRGTMMGR